MYTGDGYIDNGVVNAAEEVNSQVSDCDLVETEGKWQDLKTLYFMAGVVGVFVVFKNLFIDSTVARKVLAVDSSSFSQEQVMRLILIYFPPSSFIFFASRSGLLESIT